MWEEKPAVRKITASECNWNLAACSKGRGEPVGKTAVGGTDCRQQFMGHFSEPADEASTGPFPSAGTFVCSAAISWQ